MHAWSVILQFQEDWHTKNTTTDKVTLLRGIYSSALRNHVAVVLMMQSHYVYTESNIVSPDYKFSGNFLLSQLTYLGTHC